MSYSTIFNFSLVNINKMEIIYIIFCRTFPNQTQTEEKSRIVQLYSRARRHGNQWFREKIEILAQEKRYQVRKSYFYLPLYHPFLWDAAFLYIRVQYVVRRTVLTWPTTLSVCLSSHLVPRCLLSGGVWSDCWTRHKCGRGAQRHRVRQTRHLILVPISRWVRLRFLL